MNQLYRKHKDEWEAARMQAYLTAQVNSTKKLKPTDIISFAWESAIKTATVKGQMMDRAEIERLKQQAQKFENLL